jgi:hypothetical protein
MANIAFVLIVFILGTQNGNAQQSTDNIAYFKKPIYSSLTNDQLAESDSINLVNKLIADRLYFYNLYEMSYRMTDSALLEQKIFNLKTILVNNSYVGIKNLEFHKSAKDLFINSALLLITSLRGNLKELEKLHFPISLSQILDVKLKREIELAGGKWNRPEIQFETLESIRYKPRSIPE